MVFVKRRKKKKKNKGFSGMTGEIKIDKVRREVKLGISKMDFLADNIYIEVKTPLTSLQVDIGDHIKTKKIGKFNSTDRFVKHINELESVNTIALKYKI